MSLLSDSQVKLRLPTELKQKIELEAQDAKRSMNAEIVARLENSFNFKKIEGKYNQLREQFEQKSEVLNETRRELFKTEERLLELKLQYDESEIYHLSETASLMQKHICQVTQDSDEKIQELQLEVNALQDVVTMLIQKY